MLRRFLIWSALSVVLGLVLAGVGVWAYGHFYARFQPVTIQRGQGEIQRLLDESSWVSSGEGGRPLYLVGYREDPRTQAYAASEAAKLRAAGVEVRVLMFARPDREGVAMSTAAERATIAELWLNRDWTLYDRWSKTPVSNWTAEGVAPADGSLARSAVVEASRQFAARLDVLMKDAGVRPGYPLLIWRDREGFLKACACSDRRSWASIRDDFGAPDGLAAPETPAPEEPMAPAPTFPADTPGMPYPNLPAPGRIPYYSPPEAGPARSVQPPSSQRPNSAPVQRPGQTPSQNPRPTNPSASPPPVQEDTQFY